MNLYSYVGNNPVNWVDPTGTLAAGVIIGGAIGAVSGLVGSIAQGGDATSMLVGTGLGMLEGAAMGAMDPTEGVATALRYATLTGGVGAISNVTGQMITNTISGCSQDQINKGSVVGSFIGSALGGAMGKSVRDMAIRIMTPALADLTSAIGLAPSALGGNIGSALGENGHK